MPWVLSCHCGEILYLENKWGYVKCPKCGREYLFKYRSNKYILAKNRR